MRAQLIGDLSPKEKERMAVLGERLLIDESGSSGLEPLSSRMPRGDKSYIAGWANLRASNLALAIERLQQADDEDPHWRGHGISLPLLAIAYHESGEPEKATDMLQQSQQHLDGWLDESLTRHQGCTTDAVVSLG